jgi:integrase
MNLSSTLGRRSRRPLARRAWADRPIATRSTPDTPTESVLSIRCTVHCVESFLSPLSVFHHNGYPVKDFYGAWRQACIIANVRGQLFHDLRRTSVPNYVRSGVPERVAMAISGHKTRSIFDRYNIVSASDLQAAASRVMAQRSGKELGKIVEITPQATRHYGH